MSKPAATETAGAPSAWAWLSVATAVATLGLKAGAAYITGSVSLLSDALESIVNLVAALGAVLALREAAKPADDEHPHGHDKVEYFSSGFEGALILAAAVTIATTAIPRLLDPRPLEDTGIGLAISTAASGINLLVARMLFAAGKKHRSITLEADAHHLMTDVWTSAGVLVAVVLVRLTGLLWLDPVAALIVAANIVRTAVMLIRRSLLGLMDTALDAASQKQIDEVLAAVSASEPVSFHAVRTREAGSRRFIDLHVLVPGSWTVQQGHDLCEEVERRLRELSPRTSVLTHLEPVEDPRSFEDQQLDRASP